MINFNLAIERINYRRDLIKQVENGNEDRIKDFICAAFDTIDPIDPGQHPCWDEIGYAFNFLRSKAWKIYPAKDKNGVIQVYLESPKNEFFHSHYKK